MNAMIVEKIKLHTRLGQKRYYHMLSEHQSHHNTHAIIFQQIRQIRHFTHYIIWMEQYKCLWDLSSFNLAAIVSLSQRIYDFIIIYDC